MYEPRLHGIAAFLWLVSKEECEPGIRFEPFRKDSQAPLSESQVAGKPSITEARTFPKPS